MLTHLWVNTAFADGTTARGLVRGGLPDEVQAQLRELDTPRTPGRTVSRGGRRARCSAAASITSVTACCAILLRARGLPALYPLARFCFWLREQGLLEGVRRAAVEAAGKDWLRELNNLYVSPVDRRRDHCRPMPASRWTRQGGPATADAAVPTVEDRHLDRAVHRVGPAGPGRARQPSPDGSAPAPNQPCRSPHRFHGARRRERRVAAHRARAGRGCSSTSTKRRIARPPLTEVAEAVQTQFDSRGHARRRGAVGALGRRPGADVAPRPVPDRRRADGRGHRRGGDPQRCSCTSGRAPARRSSGCSRRTRARSARHLQGTRTGVAAGGRAQTAWPTIRCSVPAGASGRRASRRPTPPAARASSGRSCAFCTTRSENVADRELGAVIPASRPLQRARAKSGRHGRAAQRDQHPDPEAGRRRRQGAASA